MRAHHMSMSKMSLAYLCSWGFRSDSPQHHRPAGAPARIGTGVHAMADAYVRARGNKLEFAQASRRACEGMNPDEFHQAATMFSAPLQAWLDATPWSATEIGLRYDASTDTASLGPRRGQEGYADHGAMTLPGTLDLVHYDEAKCLVTVVDLKSCKLVSDREQLYAQAVAASRLYGATSARVGYLYARKTKCDEPQWETLDADALDAHAGRISRVLRRLPVAVAEAGDHCWKCDARPSCPAYESEAATQEQGKLGTAGFFA